MKNNIIKELNEAVEIETLGGREVIAIFGDPIGHSLSPAIQNAALTHLGLAFTYHAFHVKPEELKEAIAEVKKLKIPGVNITIPHKESVIEYLDVIDGDAHIIGAVNTIVNKDSTLTGFNTDGQGYLRSLKEEAAFQAKDKNILILGAGGAARGIIFALLKENPKQITIMNRTLEKAEKLAEELPITIAELNDIKAIKDASLIINTTSIGMEGTAMAGDTPISLDSVNMDCIVSDIVYKPLQTPLIKQAVTKGVRVHTGLGMLVCQGALGFELWTNAKAPIDIMMQAAQDALANTGVKG